MKRLYVWDGKAFVEVVPADRMAYGDRVAVEMELEKLAREKAEKMEHPGVYL
jgi:hypothetical protein